MAAGGWGWGWGPEAPGEGAQDWIREQQLLRVKLEPEASLSPRVSAKVSKASEANPVLKETAQFNQKAIL